MSPKKVMISLYKESRFARLTQPASAGQLYNEPEDAKGHYGR